MLSQFQASSQFGRARFRGVTRNAVIFLMVRSWSFTLWPPALLVLWEYQPSGCGSVMLIGPPFIYYYYVDRAADSNACEEESPDEHTW